jgi:hypothetical protein
MIGDVAVATADSVERLQLMAWHRFELHAEIPAMLNAD